MIIEDGIRRMYKDGESIFYYITVMNEQYEMPPMPEGAREGILKGMYRFRASRRHAKKKAKAQAQLLGSGAILNEVLKAQQILEAAVRRGGRRLERHQLPGAVSRRPCGGALEPAAPGEKPRTPWVTQCLARHRGRASSPRPTT